MVVVEDDAGTRVGGRQIVVGEKVCSDVLGIDEGTPSRTVDICLLAGQQRVAHDGPAGFSARPSDEQDAVRHRWHSRMEACRVGGLQQGPDLATEPTTRHLGPDMAGSIDQVDRAGVDLPGTDLIWVADDPEGAGDLWLGLVRDQAPKSENDVIEMRRSQPMMRIASILHNLLTQAPQGRRQVVGEEHISSRVAAGVRLHRNLERPAQRREAVRRPT
ncbi:hypothetical protein [Aeromicrobium sp. UC242_57]|uniref:hypothetical protein n=1 Tax=Aeromicrobium sp. UC242_57 TaxID=3374624 RepID=UPI0037AB00DA